MIRFLISLALAFSLGTTSSVAFAGKRCPWNDKEEPENAKICKAGTIQVCKDGQWISLGTKCRARFKDNERADAVRSLFGEPNLARERLVARIAPKS